MICEKCKQELPGAAVICRNCGYNNALQGIEGWRDKRDRVLNLSAKHPAQRPATRRSGESTVVRFPVSPERAAAAEAERAAEAELPAWRRQVLEKVRQVRQQREAEAIERAPRRDENDVNPIVEAAIRRIRREPPTNGVSSSVISGATAQATARALDYDQRQEARPETRPEPPRISSPAIVQRSAAAPAAAKKTEPDQPVSPRPSVSETTPASLHENAPQARAAVTETDDAAEVTADNETADQTAEATETAASAGEWTAPLFSHGRAGKAPLLGRAAAAFIDLQIITFSLLPFFTAATLFNVEFTRGPLMALAGLGLAMIFLYHLTAMVIAGRTCGMAVFRIRVADAADESLPPSLNQCLRRAGGAAMSVLFIPLNLLVIALSPERQSLSDQISGTQIVRQ
ncbi:MAG: RDD family protein [Blastocatellia bacterium]